MMGIAKRRATMALLVLGFWFGLVASRALALSVRESGGGLRLDETSAATQTPAQQPPAQATPNPPDAKSDSKQDPKPDSKPDAKPPSSQAAPPAAAPATGPDATKDAPKDAAKQNAQQNPPPKEGPPAKPDSKNPADPGKAAGSTFSTDMPKDLNEQPEYTVGPGDTMMVNVWKEPEVTTEVQVRGDCRITLNLIKDVEVCNMTPTQIQNLLAEKLSKYIAAPDVTVTLRNLASRKVYFIGQVKRQGGMVLNGPMTIAQALSDAGGLMDFANDKKVVIQREENGKQLHITFNYRDYLKGKNPKGNILLQPGDTIIVR